MSESLPTAKHHWLWPLLLSLPAFASVVLTIDPSGSYPSLLQGPGITVDEVFNAQQGYFLVESVALEPRLLIAPDEIFSHPKALNDHPPLGRVVLGLAERTVTSIAEPESPAPTISTAAARCGSALLFAATLFVGGWAASRWFGKSAGVFTVLAMWLTPRLFGHAHLAALETAMNFTWLLAIICVARWAKEDAISKRAAAFAGLFLGLALLTKIQGVLLPIPIAIWALICFRGRAFVPLLIWGIVGGVVFFIGWPWLWIDPIQNLQNYLTSATKRSIVFCWYLGERYTDQAVPWHYPWVMFAATVPLLWLVLGTLGLRRTESRSTRRQLGLLAVSIAFPLVLFSLPGISVYDGSRLFLICFPLWALLAGRGAKWMLDRKSKRLNIALAALVACQIGNLCWMHPYHLSHYSVLIGGGWGAEQLEMERDYWGTALSRPVLQSVVKAIPEGETIAFSPTLHPSHPKELLIQSPVLRKHKVRVVAYDPESSDLPRYLLVFHRRADISPHLSRLLSRSTLLVEVRRQGMPLASFVQLRD